MATASATNGRVIRWNKCKPFGQKPALKLKVHDVVHGGHVAAATIGVQNTGEHGHAPRDRGRRCPCDGRASRAVAGRRAASSSRHRRLSRGGRGSISRSRHADAAS